MQSALLFSSIMGTIISSKCKKYEAQKEHIEMKNTEDWKDDVLCHVETEPEALPFYPGVAYFVAFTPSDTCNGETILRTLHEQETKADVCQLHTNLKPLSNETYDEVSEKLLRELYLVVKDHNNSAVQEMTAQSNQFCLTKKMHNFVDDWNEEQLRKAFGYDISVPFQMNHFHDTPLNYC